MLGLALCYAFGTAWFMLLYTRGGKEITLLSALGMCVLPYLIPDALKLALDHILTFPDGKEDDCFLSYEPENVAAKSLYASFGFVPTGRIVEGEEEAVVQLR